MRWGPLPGLVDHHHCRRSKQRSQRHPAVTEIGASLERTHDGEGERYRPEQNRQQSGYQLSRPSSHRIRGRGQVMVSREAKGVRPSAARRGRPSDQRSAAEWSPRLPLAVAWRLLPSQSRRTATLTSEPSARPTPHRRRSQRAETAYRLGARPHATRGERCPRVTRRHWRMPWPASPPRAPRHGASAGRSHANPPSQAPHATPPTAARE